MSVFEVILVRILPHSYSVRICKNTDQNNIRKLGEITVFTAFVFSPNTGKYGPE